MNCNGTCGFGGGNCCWIVIILLVLFFCCGNSGSCGCGNSLCSASC